MTEPLFARTRWVEGGSPDGTYRLGRIEGWPCAGYITTLFGVTSSLHPNGHSGLDIGGVGETTAVRAPAAGRVLTAVAHGTPGWERLNGIFGGTVILEHAEHVSLYAHLSRITVREGAEVLAGAQIGVTGNTGFSTGAHLHWGVAPKANRWLARAEGLIDPLSLAVDARASAPSAPAAGGGLVHTVSRGDTLGAIAQRYGVTVAELVALNGLADANRIAVGQVLTVRRAAAGPSPAPAPPPTTPAPPVTPSPDAGGDIEQARALLTQVRRDLALMRGTADASIQRLDAALKVLGGDAA